jgi:plastocyanin
MRIRLAVASLAMAVVVPVAGLLAQDGSIGGTISTAKNRVADVVVFLVPVSPATQTGAAAVEAEMDQRSLKFIPNVVVVSPGSTVAFTNSDRVMHNVFHPPKGGSAFDLGLFGPGEKRSFVFKSEGAFVVFCHVHPEMVGYVVVVDTPWRRVSDDSGHFAFAKVPPGSYVLHTWHGRFEEHRQQVVVGAGEHTDVEIALTRGAPGEPRVGAPGKPE